jgi:hypothetical protein
MVRSDPIAGGVDHADVGGAVAADVDGAAVRRDTHPVRSGGDGDRGDYSTRAGIDDADGVVLEVADIRLRSGRRDTEGHCEGERAECQPSSRVENCEA